MGRTLSHEPEDLADLLMLSEDALDTENENIDPSFDINASTRSDCEHLIDPFCEDWVTHLNWEDRASLGLLLCFQLKSVLAQGETETAELAALILTSLTGPFENGEQCS